MGLFRKKAVKKVEENQIKNIDGIEIVDLDDSNEEVVNTLEQRKEFRIAIFIGVGVLLFALLLPVINKIFTKDSIFSYTSEVNEIVNNKTVDGMLEIGREEGSITAKNIKFYNPLKRNNNQISITYLPNSTIKNIDELNLYIEIYNSSKILINRTKFNNIDKLERKVQGNYKIVLDDTSYKEAKYIKFVIIKPNKNNKITDTLTCSYENIEGNIKISYIRLYNFTQDGLINYKISKIAEKIDPNNQDNTILNKYSKQFSDENDLLKKTNIEEITLTENSIIYVVNLDKFDKLKSDYNKLYEKGSIKRQIKLNDESMNWTCK